MLATLLQVRYEDGHSKIVIANPLSGKTTASPYIPGTVSANPFERVRSGRPFPSTRCVNWLTQGDDARGVIFPFEDLRCVSEGIYRLQFDMYEAD